ncbi:MAG: hypothetical protein ACREIT_05150 [Tepidisphaeraceae bacterium]
MSDSPSDPAMDNASAVQDVYRRYTGEVASLVAGGRAFAVEAEDLTCVQVERGSVFARGLVSQQVFEPSTVERLIELAGSPELSRVVVVDRGGHHRPAYRGLLVYAWLQAYRLVYETMSASEFGRWEEALRAWCDLLEAELGAVAWPGDGMPASRGASATEAAWTALALHVAGKVFVRDAWTDLASDTFGKLARGQQPNGAFLRATPSDNPETLWYHELVLLHAAASYAVQSEDRPLAACVARNTAYHLAETQPDHATSQPWGLFAFVWNPATRPLADGMLHAVRAQHPQGVTGVSLMLLADALYCLRLFL